MSRPLAWAAGVLIVALIAATVLTATYAWRLRARVDDAEGRAEIAEIARLRAEGHPYEALARARALASGARGERAAVAAVGSAFREIPTPMRVLRGSTGRSVMKVAMSANGRVIAALGSDWKLRVWDAATGEKLGEATADARFEDRLEISDDGRWVAASVARHETYWETTGFRRASEGELEAIRALFARSESLETVRLEAGATTDELERHRAGPRLILDVPVHDEQGLLVRQPARMQRADGTTAELLSFPVRPRRREVHGERLLVMSSDSRVFAWDTSTGGEPIFRSDSGVFDFEIRAALLLLRRGQQGSQLAELIGDSITAVDLPAESDPLGTRLTDGTSVVMAIPDGTIRRWTWFGEDVIARLPGSPSSFVTSRSRVAAVVDDQIFVLELAPGRPVCFDVQDPSCREGRESARGAHRRYGSLDEAPLGGMRVRVTDDGYAEVTRVAGGARVSRFRVERDAEATLVGAGDRVLVRRMGGVGLYDSATGHAVGRPLTWATDVFDVAFPEVWVDDSRQHVLLYTPNGPMRAIDLRTFELHEVEGLVGGAELTTIPHSPLVFATSPASREIRMESPRAWRLGVWDLGARTPVGVFSPLLQDPDAVSPSRSRDVVYLDVYGERRRVALFRTPAQAIAATADASNHRVCRGTDRVVVVPIDRLRDDVWAPASMCRRARARAR